MGTNTGLSGFYSFLAQPLFFRSRLFLAALVVPLLLAFLVPLWRIELSSPQHPQGLTLDVYAHTVKGGHDGADIREINILNQSMGVQALVRRELTDLDWIPFALGLIAILTLRCAAIGDVRSLVDVVVSTLYVALFSVTRFFFKLREYGHELDPDAPKRVEPFAQSMFGTTRVGDVTSTAMPHVGTALVAAFLLGATLILLHHLRVGRGRALAAAKKGEVAAEPHAEPEP